MIDRPGSVRLREMLDPDLEVFFTNQQDLEARHMAAFTAAHPLDENAFTIKWAKILGDEHIIKRTILFGDQVAGHIVEFEQGGRPEVSYWIGREFWGKGIATRALALFLEVVQERPLYARTAKDNIASTRVLQKNGFVITGEDRGFANARGEEIEEYILQLA